MQAAEAYVDEQLDTGEYPHMEALLGDGDRRATWDRLTGSRTGPTASSTGSRPCSTASSAASSTPPDAAGCWRAGATAATVRARMAPAVPHRSSSTAAPRALRASAFSYAYRAWRFTQALGRLS